MARRYIKVCVIKGTFMLNLLAWKIGFEFQNLRKVFGIGSRPTVLYFAYGANTNFETLKRRKIQPHSIRPFILQDYQMTFSQPGPFKGSAFATVHEKRYSQVYGFLLELSCIDARRMDYFEAVPFMKRHRRIYHFQDGEKVFFYQSLENRGGLMPSRRYLDLMIEGLKKHPLITGRYLEWLKGLPAGNELEFRGDLGFMFSVKSHWPKRLRELCEALEARMLGIFVQYFMHFSPSSILLPSPKFRKQTVAN